MAVMFFPMLTGIGARKMALTDQEERPPIHQLEAVDWGYFRDQFELRYDSVEGIEKLESCESTDTRTLELHAFSKGLAWGQLILRDPENHPSFSELQPPTGAQAL